MVTRPSHDRRGPLGGTRISVSPWGRTAAARLNGRGFAPDGRHNCWGISVTTDVSASN